jgi:ATP-dependent Clp protease protease subunit
MAEPTLQPSVFDRLLKDRIIWLGSEVRDDNANEIAAKLLLLAAEDPKKDIYLYINSPGGSITAGMAIYDTMQFVPNDIVTVGIGMAASMGQLLLTAGTKGKRYITPNARVLLHQPHGGFGGTSSDIQTQAQLILDRKKRLAEITADQTGKTVEQINRDGDRDRWFNAQQALEEGSRVVALDDPDLFLFPIAYLSEPGYWTPTEEEVAALRAYLLKGGFLIFDDFGGPDWINLRTQMERVLPELVPIPLDGSEPVFHSFFEIEPSTMRLLSYRGQGRPPQYFGFFEANDPTGRMLAIANYDNDIGEFWEFSATGRFPVDLSNEAYKLGVNYVVYALTH